MVIVGDFKKICFRPEFKIHELLFYVSDLEFPSLWKDEGNPLTSKVG